MERSTLRALVIEDDSEDVLLLRRMLAREEGFGPRVEFEAASSLEEGLAKLATAEFDVVLLDLMLPDSRGLGTARTVLERSPDVPLVVLTGMSDEELGLEAVRRGAQDYVVKGSADARALRRSVFYAAERRRVAELQAQVKESRRMDKLKDELMSAISHEMRNPLTVIKAANFNIMDGSMGPIDAELERMLDLQQKNILRMEKILTHILDLSRLESGRAVLRPSVFDAGQLAAEVLRGFQLLAAGRGLRAEGELPSGLPPAYADPDLVAQVLGNLLDNALRFAGSRITLRAQVLREARTAAAGAGAGRGEEEPGFLRFCVEDDGCGIKPERLGDIFRRFVQVDRPEGGEGYKGTGLGLAICKEIVERQGGRIWAQSPPGRGAAFFFTVPLRGET